METRNTLILGILVLALLTASAHAAVFRTIQNQYTNRPDYYLTYNASDFNFSSARYIENIQAGDIYITVENGTTTNISLDVSSLDLRYPGNSSSQIRQALNNSGLYNISISCQNITGSVSNLCSITAGSSSFNYTQYIDQSLNTTSAVTHSSINVSSITVDGTALNQPWNYRSYYRYAEWESVTTGIGIEPWVPTAVTSGTSALVIGNYSHPGMATVSRASSATAGSGYCYVISGATTFVLGANYQTTYVGQPQFGGLNTLANGTTARFGFFDVFTHATPVDAVLWNMTVLNSTTWNYTPQIFSNSAMTAGVGYQYTPRTAYDLPRHEIKILNNTLTQFGLYNSSGALLYAVNVSAAIPSTPTRATSHGVCYFATAGAPARVLGQHDYISVAATNLAR